MPTSGRYAAAAATVVVVNVVLAPPAYFVAFLFAYGFSDGIEPAQHVFFLVEIGVVAAVLALGCTPVVVGATRSPFLASTGFTACVVASAHLLALGLGTIVSNLHTDEGSVTASWSTTAMVLVPAVLIGGAVLAAAAAVTVARRQPASS